MRNVGNLLSLLQFKICAGERLVVFNLSYCITCTKNKSTFVVEPILALRPLITDIQKECSTLYHICVELILNKTHAADELLMPLTSKLQN